MTDHPQCHDDVNIHELLKQRREIAIVWCIEDVQCLRPDLDNDQSWQVLQRCERAHDCNYGFTWDLIQSVADDLFPVAKQGDGQ